MLFNTQLLSAVLLASALAIEAKVGGHPNRADHHRRVSHPRRGGSNAKRCPAKSSAPAPAPTSKPWTPSSSSVKPASTGTGKTPPSDVSGGNPGSIIQFTDWDCGGPRATPQSSKLTGPNGNIDWINCGIDGGGWNPPQVKLNELVVIELADSLKNPHSPHQRCERYLDMFNDAANQYGVPAVALASLAMQESSCNADTVGGAGEQGLMQLTADKCPEGVAGPGCLDPWYNIHAGAKFFSETLQNNGNNIFLTLGNYNGWSQGMTYGQATASANTCCRCQNNLDYVHQQVNGWFVGVNPYDTGMGKYNNLKDCT